MNNRELKFRIWDKQYCKWLKNSNSLHCYSNWAICPFTGNLVDYVGAIDGDHGDTFTASPAADYYLEGTKLVKEPRYVIQQYTGLKDKNGKEIYEGDILKVKITDEVIPTNNGRKINACVCWDNFHACWIVEGKIEKGSLNGEQYPFGCNENCYIDYHSPVAVDAKIIGNVMQNPELIKNNA